LEGYTDAKSTDSTLKAKAIDYVNCLKEQKDSLDYVNVEYTKCQDEWSAAYDARTQLINLLDKDGINVESTYASVGS
jgi:DNA topoisomerase IA